jgi:hypothetical protein
LAKANQTGYADGSNKASKNAQSQKTHRNPGGWHGDRAPILVGRSTDCFKDKRRYCCNANDIAFLET